MSRPAHRWMLTTSIAALVAVITLAACGLSSAGSIVGALLAALFVGVLALGSLTQSGCDSRPVKADGSTSIGPCLSVSDGGVGPCLTTDSAVGPCLGAPQPDLGVCLSAIPPDLGACLTIDAYVGPCLEPPLPDAGVDAYVGPCLDIAPDAGADNTVSPCLFVAPDAGVDACLGMAALDRTDNEPLTQPQRRPVDPSLAQARRAALERLSAVLPADVLRRLTEKGRDRS